jgi:hypothetical protein
LAVDSDPPVESRSKKHKRAQPGAESAVLIGALSGIPEVADAAFMGLEVP